MSCCARSSWGRPTASSPSSPRATARSARWPRASASRGAASGPGSSPRATSRCSATGARELDIVTQVETHRRQPGAAGALRLPHPRGLDARGHRPGRPGARGQPGAVPHARRARCARSPTDPSPLVSAAFFWKLLSLEGFHPLLDACARAAANEDGPFTAFDLDEGGVLCEHVRPLRRAARSSPRRSRWSRRILGGELRGALAEPPERGHDRGRAARASRASSTTSSAGCASAALL